MKYYLLLLQLIFRVADTRHNVCVRVLLLLMDECKVSHERQDK